MEEPTTCCYAPIPCSVQLVGLQAAACICAGGQKERIRLTFWEGTNGRKSSPAHTCLLPANAHYLPYEAGRKDFCARTGKLCASAATYHVCSSFMPANVFTPDLLFSLQTRSFLWDLPACSGGHCNLLLMPQTTTTTLTGSVEGVEDGGRDIVA